MANSGIPPIALFLALTGVATPVAAQQAKPQNAKGGVVPADRPSAATSVRPDYIIGTEDVLTIVFWRDKDLSGDFIVRPDGKISLPLLRDVEAAGSTPEQLRARLVEAATQYLED